MSKLSYTLLIDQAPASGELLEVLQQLEVEDHADVADMLRMRFAVSVGQQGSRWNVLDDSAFDRLANVRLLVTVGNGPPETLIDAYVVETNAQFSNTPGTSTLDVAAMDPTVLMNLEEKPRAWPNMADSDIATSIFGDYNFLLDVEATQPRREESDVTSMQHGTDIQFLRQLAKRNGYEVYVESQPLTGLPVGHFHRPRLDQEPQGVLTVNLGEATNVNSFNARFDMTAPLTARADGIQIGTQEDQRTDVDRVALQDLGNRSTVASDRPRRVILSGSGLTERDELQTLAEAAVDRSAWAITAEGELNTIAYGRLLRAKRPVLVRGAGRQFSGTYYVERVHHTFTGDGYTQHFTLRRNAREVTGSESFVQDEALPS